MACKSFSLTSEDLAAGWGRAAGGWAGAGRAKIPLPPPHCVSRGSRPPSGGSASCKTQMLMRHSDLWTTGIIPKGTQQLGTSRNQALLRHPQWFSVRGTTYTDGGKIRNTFSDFYGMWQNKGFFLLSLSVCIA